MAYLPSSSLPQCGVYEIKGTLLSGNPTIWGFIGGIPDFRKTPISRYTPIVSAVKSFWDRSSANAVPRSRMSPTARMLQAADLAGKTTGRCRLLKFQIRIKEDFFSIFKHPPLNLRQLCDSV